MGTHSQALLDQKYIEMLKLLNIYLNHFPKHEKYALCSRIRNTAYGLYDLITETQKRYHKKTTLTAMDVMHEQLRMQVRLAYELGYFRFKDGREVPGQADAHALHRLTTLEALVDEIGRMIGGWILYERKHEKGGTPTCA